MSLTCVHIYYSGLIYDCTVVNAAQNKLNFVIATENVVIASHSVIVIVFLWRRTFR